jgi:hypothetical protein
MGNSVLDIFLLLDLMISPSLYQALLYVGKHNVFSDQLLVGNPIFSRDIALWDTYTVFQG